MKLSVSTDVQSHADEVLNELQQAKLRALETIGLVAEGYAKEKIREVGAYDTGRLWNSISHAVSESEQAAVIGTNVEYAPYVELGTSKMDPRPYLQPAATNHIDEYRQIVDEVMRGEEG